MAFHAPEDVIEGADGCDDLGSLVKHHAFGPHTHRRVGHLGAGRPAIVREGFEDLGRPDGWYVGSFAKPENLFLNLRQALVANLNGEVAVERSSRRQDRLRVQRG